MTHSKHPDPSSDQSARECETQEHFEQEMLERPSTRLTPRWTRVLWIALIIGVGTWAIQDWLTHLKSSGTIENLEGNLANREGKKAQLFRALGELKQKRDEGLITSEEYQAELDRILSRKETDR